MTRDQVICMIGTDHGLAPANVRSAFSLPADVREAAVSLARAKLGATGVVLLATCNRTELWASFDGVEPPVRALDERGAPTADDPLLRAVCEMHMVDPERNARYFACRSGDVAVNHLFNVACGLRSAIVAEDQIVSQVKQAIAYSREIGVADSVLEVLFRQAVTAAKQVKGGVRFTRAYSTAVDQAVALLEEGGSLQGVSCVVIGNGEYGRLAASTLVEHGARVLVTVRQYTHGAVTVPRGCESVPYADRYQHLSDCKVVMSATTSPHYTLERAAVEECGPFDGTVFVDLAIPHDIDPAIAELPGCTLRDIDSFATEIGSENAQAIEAAQRLLASGAAEFWDWMERRKTMAHATPAGSWFPLFIDFSEKRAVFVGGGTIALRRIRTLMPFVGELVVYAPEFTPELERFADDGTITLVRQRYDTSVLDGADIVFACTNDSDLNDEIWAECKRRNTLVNVCSDRYKCDFYFPGVVQSEGMVIGVSAGGKDHRRVRQVRARIEQLLEEEDI
ncbi:MAG: hypothetical protein IJ111_09670 [Eggerthellaceae bacterium]|nr:hypothetical protein [Eggerthellaceae bacterium]